MAAPPLGRCPLCGQRTVTTLDHYLPKAKFSPLVVVPANLVPSCFECNKAKTDSTSTSAEAQPLHPYFDDVDSDQWLTAAVVEARPAAVVFNCEPPAAWDATKIGRTRNHFLVLGLRTLYASYASEELSILRDLLLFLNSRQDDGVPRLYLSARAEAHRAAHLNSWQSAMYSALAESDWYCSGGFKF